MRHVRHIVQHTQLPSNQPAIAWGSGQISVEGTAFWTVIGLQLATQPAKMNYTVLSLYTEMSHHARAINVSRFLNPRHR